MVRVRETLYQAEQSVVVARKVLFLFTPLMFEELLRVRAFFGSTGGVVSARNKAFCSRVVANTVFFHFNTLRRLARFALLFLYNVISKSPRSSILIVNGILKNSEKVADMFDRTMPLTNCPYLLSWFPGFLSNFRCVRRAYARRTQLFLQKRRLTQRQYHQLRLFKSDRATVAPTSFWRFPSVLVFLNASENFASAAKEAASIQLPSVGLVDSDSLAWMELSYYIPWNVKTVLAAQFFLSLVAEALVRGFLVNLFHLRVGDFILAAKFTKGLPIRSDQEEGSIAYRRRLFSERRPLRLLLQFGRRSFQRLTKHRQKIVLEQLRVLSKLSRYWLGYSANFLAKNPYRPLVRSSRGRLCLNITRLFLLRKFLFCGRFHRFKKTF